MDAVPKLGEKEQKEVLKYVIVVFMTITVR